MNLPETKLTVIIFTVVKKQLPISPVFPDRLLYAKQRWKMCLLNVPDDI